MSTLLEVDAIDVFYGSVQALRGLSLRIEDGERIALLGANGAGKTTTLRAVSGLIHPRQGSVRFDGRDITKLEPHDIVGLGLAHLPEGRDLFPTLTVEENLRYGYYVRRKDRAGYVKARDRVMDYFPKLRERAGQAAATMSGGEQQMLGVARALMSSPKLLCVDELSLGLAPIVVEHLFEILGEDNREGTSLPSSLADNPDLMAAYLGEAPDSAVL